MWERRPDWLAPMVSTATVLALAVGALFVWAMH
jgi:hypothetical protein